MLSGWLQKWNLGVTGSGRIPVVMCIGSDAPCACVCVLVCERVGTAAFLPLRDWRRSEVSHVRGMSTRPVPSREPRLPAAGAALETA